MQSKWMAFLLLTCLAGSGHGQPESGGTLNYSSTRRLVGYDPVSHFNLATSRLASLIFETLVERNPRGPGVVGRLAMSWSESRTGITFRLRPNALWHDGKKLTAWDVAFTWNLLRDPRSGSPLREQFAFIQSVQVLDEQHIQFLFAQPQDQAAQAFLGFYVLPRHRFASLEAPFPESEPDLLTNRFPEIPVRESPSPSAKVLGELPVRAWVRRLKQQEGWIQVKVVQDELVDLQGWIPEFQSWLRPDHTDFFVQPIGTGPYRFSRVDLSGNVALESFDDYHQGAPPIAHIQRRRSSDKNTMVNRLVQDLLDLLPESPFEDLARIRASSCCQSVEYPSLRFSGIAHNTRHPLLAEKVFRRAITFALNREELLLSYYQNQGVVLPGPYSPHSWAYDFELEPLPWDLPQAQQFLQRFLTQQDPSLRSLRLIISNDRPGQDLNVCHTLASILGELGLNIEVLVLERLVFEKALRQGDFELAFCEWTFDHSYDVEPLFHTNGVLNFTGYTNPQVTRILEALDQTLDGEKRFELARHLQRLLRDDCPYTFLWTTRNIASVHRKVANIKSTNIDPYTFFQRVAEWWIRSE